MTTSKGYTYSFDSAMDKDETLYTCLQAMNRLKDGCDVYITVNERHQFKLDGSVIDEKHLMEIVSKKSSVFGYYFNILSKYFKKMFNRGDQ
jgi:hypothetical protein